MRRRLGALGACPVRAGRTPRRDRARLTRRHPVRHRQRDRQSRQGGARSGSLRSAPVRLQSGLRATFTAPAGPTSASRAGDAAGLASRLECWLDRHADERRDVAAELRGRIERHHSVDHWADAVVGMIARRNVTPMTPTGRRLLYVGGFDFPTTRPGASRRSTRRTPSPGPAGRPLLAQRPEAARPLRRRGPGRLRAGSRTRELRIVPLPVARVDRLSWLEIHKRLGDHQLVVCAVPACSTCCDCPYRPTAILTRDPRLAWAFLQTRALHRRPVVYEVHEIFSTRPRDNRRSDPDGSGASPSGPERWRRPSSRRSDLLMTADAGLRRDPA